MEEIHYLIWNRCNLLCPFCIHPHVTEEASFLFQKNIIDQIVVSWISKITISGWEPLLIPHIERILKYIHTKWLECVLHTNGLLLTQESIKKISPYISRISLTLDAIEEGKLVLMRSNGSISKHTLECISWAHENWVPVSIKTLITKVNQHDMLMLWNLIQNLWVSHRTLIPFLPIERWLWSKDLFYIQDIEVRKIVDDTKKLFPNISIKDHINPIAEKYCFIDAEWIVYTNKKSWEKKYIWDVKKISLSNIVGQYFT